MPRTTILARLAFVTSFAIAAPLAAQGSDTTGALPFRRGQWATQFGFDGSFLSAGALRFRSPTSAWVVDALVQADRSTYERNGDATVPPVEMTATDFALGLQLGARGYRAIAPRVNGFAGAGVSGRAYSTRFVYPGSITETPTQREGSAGIYGEMGATWMVTRNLGLSGATQLAASYLWSSYEAPSAFGTSRVESTGYGVQLARTRLIVTVFF
jgi:hypothetical protein